MDKDSAHKWESLISQINITLELTREPTTLSESEILRWESLTQISLPNGYKEFCQIFGQGCFDNGFVCIDCPSIEDTHGQLISNTEIIHAAKSQHENLPLVHKLLDSAYLFGLGQSTLFVFDLKMSCDQNYDIYAIDDDGQIYKVGRDFFEFVRDFCIGEKAAKEFPELLRAMGLFKDSESNATHRYRTFTPISYNVSEE